MDETADSIIKRIAFIGNYLPRQCGIATFKCFARMPTWFDHKS